MGALLPSYKEAVISSILNGISTNTTCLYAYASNPVAYSGNTPPIVLSDYSALFVNDWQMLFGKRIQIADIVPVIDNTQWVSNTIYTQYDNTNANLATNDFYVLTPPQIMGGPFNVYKCINNANGAPSTQMPTQVQPNSFTTADGYTWRYTTSITAAEYDKFFTALYAPCYTNTTLAASASLYTGVENCIITNGGNGYSSYSISNSNFVVAVANSTQIQIQNYESQINNFYAGNGIYIYNSQSATSQLLTVAGYISNSIGNFITLSTPANTAFITPSITKYYISPQVVFTSDANVAPQAYTTINTTSNSVLSLVIINTGYGISWCNVSIVTNASSVASNATAYAIVPPPGGHGFDPASELFVQGMGISFTFSNSESNSIPTNITYNQIGIFNDPLTLNTNNTPGLAYTTNSFSQVLQANLSPTTTFVVGNVVTGTSSGAVGTVAFCNGTNIFLTGDKSFANNETIVSSNGVTSANININTLGQVYAKSIKPLYIQNISNVVRSNSAAESYKLVITI